MLATWNVWLFIIHTFWQQGLSTLTSSRCTRDLQKSMTCDSEQHPEIRAGRSRSLLLWSQSLLMHTVCSTLSQQMLSVSEAWYLQHAAGGAAVSYQNNICSEVTTLHGSWSYSICGVLSFAETKGSSTLVRPYCAQAHLPHKVWIVWLVGAHLTVLEQGTHPWPWHGRKRRASARYGCSCTIKSTCTQCRHDNMTECLLRLLQPPINRHIA